MPYYFTKKGLDSKKQQINKQGERVRSAQKEAADAAGVSYDWHDNFGYEDAQRQAEQETNTLVVLKREFKEAKEINIEEQQQEVLIGTTIIVSFGSEEKEFTIGAYEETNPKMGLISYVSPLAMPLIKMRVGERKIIDVGGKKIAVEIKKIFPPSYRYVELIKRFYNESGFGGPVVQR